mmetsp:Transcript_17606/g.35380  ORF Transcript_17606/g.35380 Transcript_17606/m.35380 type:complete len:238 (+) Transcript_17606:856-1569(+)
MLAPSCAVNCKLEWTPTQVLRFATACTRTVPTKPESGMKEKAPLPSVAICTSRGVSRSYPKPKVWIVGLKAVSLAMRSFKAPRMPFGGKRCSLGCPSVKNKMDGMESASSPPRAASSRTSNAFSSASHMFVQPEGTCSATCCFAAALFVSVIGSKGETTRAAVENATTDNLSPSFIVSITVFIACFVISSTEKPTSTCSPPRSTVAAVPMDPETSIRATKLSFVVLEPSGGLIVMEV